MKIKNILMCSLLLAGLSSCNDYLDVDAPSKVTDKQVFSSTAVSYTHLRAHET